MTQSVNDPLQAYSQNTCVGKLTYLSASYWHHDENVLLSDVYACL